MKRPITSENSGRVRRRRTAILGVAATVVAVGALGHHSIRDLLKDAAQLARVLDGLARYLGVDAMLVQLMRAEHLYVHLHLRERLFERHEKMLGVGDMAAFGVWYVRETVADVFLVAPGDARGYLAQRVDSVRVKDETDLLTALPQSVRDRLCDETGDFRKFINIYVNQEDVRFLDGRGSQLKDGDEVSIVPAIAGGR